MAPPTAIEIGEPILWYHKAGDQTFVQLPPVKRGIAVIKSAVFQNGALTLRQRGRGAWCELAWSKGALRWDKHELHEAKAAFSVFLDRSKAPEATFGAEEVSKDTDEAIAKAKEFPLVKNMADFFAIRLDVKNVRVVFKNSNELVTSSNSIFRIRHLINGKVSDDVDSQVAQKFRLDNLATRCESDEEWKQTAAEYATDEVAADTMARLHQEAYYYEDDEGDEDEQIDLDEQEKEALQIHDAAVAKRHQEREQRRKFFAEAEAKDAEEDEKDASTRQAVFDIFVRLRENEDEPEMGFERPQFRGGR